MHEILARNERKSLKAVICSTIVVGILGLCAYYLTLPPTTDEIYSNSLAEVNRAKQVLIDNNLYESSLQEIPRFFRNAIVKNTYRSDDGGRLESTGILIDFYIDQEGYAHYIQVANQHGVMQDAKLTIIHPTAELEIQSYTCTPFDYIGKNPTIINPSEPVIDIAICDLNTGKYIHHLPSSINGVPPELFINTDLSKISPNIELRVYGFPLAPTSDQSTLPFASEYTLSTDNLTLHGLTFFDGIFGLGGTGSPLINLQDNTIIGFNTVVAPAESNRIDRLLTNLKLTPSDFLHGVAPIPSDFVEKVALFKKQVKNNDLPAYPNPELLTWNQ